MTATTCIAYTTRRQTIDRLTDCHGPTLDLGDGRFLPLDATITRLGRRPGSDLELDDQSVASRHALVLNAPVGVFLLADRGGEATLVNGHRAARAELEDGDEIQLGAVRLTYREPAAIR